MSFGTFIVTDFATRTAIDPVVLEHGEFCSVRVHAKEWNGVAPNTKDLLFKCRGNMHQAGVMAEYIPRLLNQRRRFVYREFSTGVIDKRFLIQFAQAFFKWFRTFVSLEKLHYFISGLLIFLSPQSYDRLIDLIT